MMVAPVESAKPKLTVEVEPPPDERQLSVAVAIPVAAGVVSSPQSTVSAGGQAITGATESSTVMFWVQLDTFPEASVAE